MNGKDRIDDDRKDQDEEKHENLNPDEIKIKLM